MKKSDSLREQEIPMVLGVVELNRITLTPQRFPIRPTPPEVVSMTNNPIEVINFPPDPAPHTGIYRDIIALSSGTIRHPHGHKQLLCFGSDPSESRILLSPQLQINVGIVDGCMGLFCCVHQELS